jgi:hypothetical protein
LVLWSTLGRHQWFSADEWDYLATRKAGDLGDLFRPHNEHWQTIPVLFFRFLYALVGLRTYLPYQLAAIALHLTAAWLLWLIMRRAQVQPWLATAAASLFALFGTGYQDIIWGFQVGFTGALVLGLTHLLLADHDGPMERRDWLGLLAGLAGLMMSGVAVTMVIVVGLAVLMRRGWRASLFHAAPLAGCYLTWYAVIGHTGYSKHHPTSDGVPRLVARALQSTYAAMGQLRGIGLSLAVLLIVGFPLAALTRKRVDRLRELATPAALIVGSVVFITIAATGRSGFGPSWFSTRSRYIHLIAAMTLPALAVSVDAFVRRFRWCLPIGVALFVAAVPGNIQVLAHQQRGVRRRNDVTRQTILTIAHDPFARQLPRGFRPWSRDPGLRVVTLGWLLDGVAQHRVPDPPQASPQDLARGRLLLSFRQQTTPTRARPCHPITSAVTVPMHAGDAIGLHGVVDIAPTHHPIFLTMRFVPSGGQWLLVLRDTGPITIRGVGKRVETLLCTQAKPITVKKAQARRDSRFEVTHVASGLCDRRC